MALRPLPYRLIWPWTPHQIEGQDEINQILFKTVSALESRVAALPSGGSGSGSTTPASSGVGTWNGGETDGSLDHPWPVGPSAPPSSLTKGSVVFAGPGGVLAQDNPNLFWNDTTNVLGIGTNTPGGVLHVVVPAFSNHDTDAQQVIVGSGTNGYGVRIGL